MSITQSVFVVLVQFAGWMPGIPKHRPKRSMVHTKKKPALYPKKKQLYQKTPWQVPKNPKKYTEKNLFAPKRNPVLTRKKPH